MNSIWSNNKYISIVINVLLFLLGINFFHYGQFILPVICLILFINNKYKIKVNNIKTFIVLILFSISYFAFSYKQGFYSVMGFCLPMAYYIGSNIKDTSENSAKSIIYLISFGMICHVMLNFLMDYILNGMWLFKSSSHYDFWIPGKMPSTITTINCVPIIGFLYYLFKYEKNKRIKYLFIVLFIVFIIYNFGLGQRTVYLLTFLSFFISIIIDIIINNNKTAKKSIIIIVCIFTLMIVLFNFNIFNIQEKLFYVRLIRKFLEQGFSTNRFDIFLETVKNMPYHLFGNKEISTLLGIMPHDLWLDVYDWGGIITFILLVIHTVLFIKVFIDFVRNRKVSNEFKVFIIPMFVCIGIQCLLEPVMSGASLFLIVVILFESLLENYLIREK